MNNSSKIDFFLNMLESSMFEVQIFMHYYQRINISEINFAKSSHNLVIVEQMSTNSSVFQRMDQKNE